MTDYWIGVDTGGTFTDVTLLDRETGLAMSAGETAIVTEGACEPVNHAPRELVVN